MSNRRYVLLLVVLLTLLCGGAPYPLFSTVSLAQSSDSQFRNSATFISQRTSRPLVSQVIQGEEALNRLKQDGSYDSLAEAMTAARYSVNWVANPRLPHLNGAYEAVNPAQGVTSYFTPEGVYLVATGEGTPQWFLEMKLQGIGYGDNVGEVSAGTPTVIKNRVELQRNSSVSTLHSSVKEWYVNRPAGLEQGLTIDSAPGQRTPENWLRVAFQVATTLEARLESNGQAIDFIDQSGEHVVRYDKLVVTDALEKRLPAWMRLEAGQVVLEIDDSTATYPVMIDPTLTQQVKLLAADASGGGVLGSSVSISGDTVVVGAPGSPIGTAFSQGAAYVFVRNGAAWSQQQKLTASDGAANFSFGWSVSISGETLVVGAIGANVTGSSKGAAYVFVRNGTTWSEQQKLIALDGATGDEFGTSAAISGETIVVGSYRATIGANLRQGTAYVYVRTGTNWSQQQKLIASDGATNDFFGQTLAISGDVIVIGAMWARIGANLFQGAAYVFSRSGTTWTQQQKLTASDGMAFENFGNSVAISGQTIVVGSKSNNINTNLPGGSAYVFVWTGTIWAEQQELMALDGRIDDFFGTSVAISGDTVVVGEPGLYTGEDLRYGSAYVFVRTGTTWRQQYKTIGLDPSPGANFASSVAVSGTTILAGAPNDSALGPFSHGAVYVFEVYPDTAYTSSLYVADTGNNRIQRFDGTSWSVVGSGIAGAGVGQFRLPEAVTTDLSGNVIYVADTGNQRIQWSTDRGASWKVFASIGSGLNQVRSPQGLALDTSGNLYISDTGNNRVVRFDGGRPGPGVVLLAPGSSLDQVNSPRGLALDTTFNLYVADCGNNRILKVTGADQPAPVQIQIVAKSGAALNQVSQPQGVAIDHSGNLVIADTGNSRVLVFVRGNSAMAGLLALSGAGLGQVRNPEGVTFSVFSAGPLAGRLMLSVGDTGNSRIVGLDLGDAITQSSATWVGSASFGFWQLVGTPNRLGSQVGQFRAPSKVR